MSIELKKVVDFREVYAYMQRLTFPYRYEASYDRWESSFLSDTDGEGRRLFSEFTTVGAYVEDQLAGVIQYGRTAFGFDENGEISDAVSYSVIRNFYFDEAQRAAGVRLLQEAVKELSNPAGRLYAFFHYFGMSCYARHGKLFEGFAHIHHLLLRSGFAVEHENVFYSSILHDEEQTEILLNWHKESPGGQQYCDFLLKGDIVGGCELHVHEQGAYLRWIFIHDELRGKGLGTQCLSALRNDLLHRGILRFDTDTALTNKAAQHFYEKNGFVREGLTRSYDLNR